MLFADLIPQDAKDLGSLGVNGLLGLGVFTFAGVIVYLFLRQEKERKEQEARLDEKQDKHDRAIETAQAKHDMAIREHRTEFTAALSKVTDAVKAVAEESRASAVECRANITALREDLKRDRG